LLHGACKGRLECAGGRGQRAGADW
jgi:hypothetical protein